MPRLNRAQQAWQDQDSYATTLLAMFVDKYGTEGLSWDPETIALEVEDDWDVELPRLCHDRLMTAIQILTTDSFYKSLPDFIAFCNVLAGTPYRPDTWDPADASEVAWGVTEALLLNPPEQDDEEPFTDEIRAYVGMVLDDEGIINAPDILRIALRGHPDLHAKIQADFSDDPEMFSAIYSLEQSKTDDLNSVIRDNLRQLSHQLDALELSTGNSHNAVAQMVRALNQVPTTPAASSSSFIDL